MAKIFKAYMGQTLPDWMLEKAATEAAAMDELYLRVMQAPSWDVALPRFQAILKSLHTVLHFAGGEKGLLAWMGFTGHVVDLKVLCHRHLLLVREAPPPPGSPPPLLLLSSEAAAGGDGSASHLLRHHNMTIMQW